jgi:hypothetical protein
MDASSDPDLRNGDNHNRLDNPIKYPADEAKQILDDIKKAMGI